MIHTNNNSLQPKTYMHNDIEYCELNCPFLRYNQFSVQLDGCCTIYGDLNFYDWYIAKCKEHSPPA